MYQKQDENITVTRRIPNNIRKTLLMFNFFLEDPDKATKEEK